VPHRIRDGADLPVPCNCNRREGVPAEIQDQRAQADRTGPSRRDPMHTFVPRNKWGLRPIRFRTKHCDRCYRNNFPDSKQPIMIKDNDTHGNIFASNEGIIHFLP
jgi:hypothetical protein